MQLFRNIIIISNNNISSTCGQVFIQLPLQLMLPWVIEQYYCSALGRDSQRFVSHEHRNELCKSSNGLCNITLSCFYIWVNSFLILITVLDLFSDPFVAWLPSNNKIVEIKTFTSMHAIRMLSNASKNILSVLSVCIALVHYISNHYKSTLV